MTIIDVTLTLRWLLNAHARAHMHITLTHTHKMCYQRSGQII